MNELERRPGDVVTKIRQIFKQAVLRFWSLRVPLIVVCILLAALLCTAQYQDSSRVASAQMTLNYSEASHGLNPNRTRFTTTDLTSDEVLQSTLYNAGLEGQMTVEQLRKAITVEPTDVTNVSSSENYITTSCSISLQLEEPCPQPRCSGSSAAATRIISWSTTERTRACSPAPCRITLAPSRICASRA